MQESTKPITSHLSLMGIFISLTIILSIPLFIFASNDKKNMNQRASAADSSKRAPVNTGFLSGYVFIDGNRNGVRDYDEAGAAGIGIDINQSNRRRAETSITDITTTVISDASGYFRYDFAGLTGHDVQVLNIGVAVELPDNFKTINTNPMQLENIDGNSREVVEIGIFPI